MSYSFNLRAASKEAAKAAVAEKFDKEVVVYQSVHARDRDAVIATSSAMIDLLADDDSKDVAVNCNGYVCWVGQSADGKENLLTTSIACAANLVSRE